MKSQKAESRRQKAAKSNFVITAYCLLLTAYCSYSSLIAPPSSLLFNAAAPCYIKPHLRRAPC